MPQQERGQRRVAALVSAAESVMAEVGYEAATMSAIAEKSQGADRLPLPIFPQ